MHGLHQADLALVRVEAIKLFQQSCSGFGEHNARHVFNAVLAPRGLLGALQCCDALGYEVEMVCRRHHARRHHTGQAMRIPKQPREGLLRMRFTAATFLALRMGFPSGICFCTSHNLNGPCR